MSIRPLVIEFIGLPGAGKTTIAQNTIENLSADGYSCYGLSTLDNPESLEKEKGGLFSKLRMLYYFSISCVLFWRFAINALLFLMQLRPFSLVNLRRFLILLVRLKSVRALMDGNYDFIILDQGLIQYIWSMAVTGEQQINSKYLELVMKSILDEIPLFVIMVDIETELAINRIVSRPTMRSRFDRISPSEAKVILSKHREMFTQIVYSADTFRETGYLNVNGNQPVKENVGLIVPFIEQARQGYSA